jgi:peptidoglycan/LPS O-acetylase OafA/YrhL
MTTAGAAYVVICLCSGLAGAIVGKLKGSSFVLWFLIAAILPLIGLAAALAYRFENRELRRQCPNCGKVTKLHDAVCTRCGAELEFPDVAIAPEAARYTR